MPIEDVLDTLALVDHHCHGLFPEDLEDERLAESLSEAYAPAPAGTSHWDKPVALSVRRWCAPVLDLAPLASPAEYATRRRALGAAEVNRRFPRGGGDRHLHRRQRQPAGGALRRRRPRRHRRGRGAGDRAHGSGCREGR